jgi:hypothetical protein
MKSFVAATGVLAALVLCACPISYKFSRTTSASSITKPEGCAFDLLTTHPAQPHVELGVVDFDRGGTTMASTAQEFMDAVRAQVCAAGGDAVVGEINGHGYYVRGVVIRYGEEGSSQRPAPGTSI